MHTQLHKHILYWVVWLLMGSLASACKSLTPDKILKNKHFSWTHVETHNFNLFIKTPSYADSNRDATIEQAKKAYAKTLKTLGMEAYSGKINLFVIANRDDMQQLAGIRGNGSAYPHTHTAVVVYAAHINALTAHELVHVMGLHTWGKTSDWISEGLAVYADSLWWNQPIHQIALFLHHQNLLPPLKNLFNYFRDINSLIAYPMAGSFCKYLIDVYGMEKFKQLYVNKGKHLEVIYGKTTEQLEADWKKTIAQENVIPVKYPELQ